MKKLLQIGVVVCGLLTTTLGFSEDNSAIQKQAQNRYTDPKASTNVQDRAVQQGQNNSSYVNNKQGYQNYQGYDNNNRGGYQNYSRGGSYGDNVQRTGSHEAGYQYQYGSAQSAQCVSTQEDQATGDCWCLYCHYEPCYYNTYRCVEEQIPCKKKCCRYVDKEYQVQRCRMVPQYYCETCCRKEPEYYEVDDCKCCKKTVCDQHCEYKPKYYWKHVCNPTPACNTCQ